MRKRMSGQIKPGLVPGLALCLVDGHDEGWPKGNCLLLNLKGSNVSVGLELMQGMKTTLPMLQPITISA